MMTIKEFLANLDEKYPAREFIPPAKEFTISLKEFPPAYGSPDCFRGNISAIRAYQADIASLNNLPYIRRVHEVSSAADRLDAMRWTFEAYGVEAAAALRRLADGATSEPQQNTMPTTPTPKTPPLYRIFTEEGIEVYRVRMSTLDITWHGDASVGSQFLLRGRLEQPTTPHGVIGGENEELRRITVPDHTAGLDPDSSANLR